MNTWLLLLMALTVGAISGVVTSVLSEKVIRASERARMRAEVLGDDE